MATELDSKRYASEKRERLRTYSDDVNTPKQMRRCDSGNSTFSNITLTDSPPEKPILYRKSSCSSKTRLEDLITCPIHLGMMEDPRILLCGHAFCLTCLKDYIRIKQSSLCTLINFECPVCRTFCEISNLDNLPPSLAHKQLSDYIVETQSQYYLDKYYPNNKITTSQTSGLNSLSTIDQKRDLVLRLIRDIVPNHNDKITDFYCKQLDRILDQMENSNSPPSSPENQVVNSSINFEVFNSNYELMDVETIRENMKKYSEYKLQRDINRCLINCLNNQAFIYEPNNSKRDSRMKIVSIDVNIVQNEPDIFIWINNHQRSVFVKKRDYATSQFNIITQDNGEILKPFFIKLIVSNESQKILVSANSLNSYGLFLYLLDGTVLQSAIFNTIITLVAGFFYDSPRSRVLVCLPNENRITILENLVESGQGYHFTDLHPTYITYNRATNEIWASCPQDGRIVIVDEISGSYRQLGTNQIYNALPSHITISQDHRVLFLDSHKNRVFWVRKRHDFILIQRITFSGGTKSMQLLSNISAMISIHSPSTNGSSSPSSSFGNDYGGGRLMFSTGNNSVLVVKPIKSLNNSHSNNNSGNHPFSKYSTCNIV